MPRAAATALAAAVSTGILTGMQGAKAEQASFRAAPSPCPGEEAFCRCMLHCDPSIPPPTEDARSCTDTVAYRIQVLGNASAACSSGACAALCGIDAGCVEEGRQTCQALAALVRRSGGECDLDCGNSTTA